MPLADWSFEPSDTELTVTPDGAVLEWVAQRGPITVRLVYTFRPDSYVFDVVGRIEGLETSGLMLVSLGPRLALVEADSALDFRSYSVVTKAGKTESVTFRSLDPGERRDPWLGRSSGWPSSRNTSSQRCWRLARIRLGSAVPWPRAESVSAGTPCVQT